MRVGGAYLAGEQTARDGFPLHSARACGGLRSCQVPLGFQQPLLQLLPQLMETGFYAAELRVLVLDINTTQRLRGGAAAQSGKTTRDNRRRAKSSLCFK